MRCQRCLRSVSATLVLNNAFYRMSVSAPAQPAQASLPASDAVLEAAKGHTQRNFLESVVPGHAVPGIESTHEGVMTYLNLVRQESPHGLDIATKRKNQDSGKPADKVRMVYTFGCKHPGCKFGGRIHQEVAGGALLRALDENYPAHMSHSCPVVDQIERPLAELTSELLAEFSATHQEHLFNLCLFVVSAPGNSVTFPNALRHVLDMHNLRDKFALLVDDERVASAFKRFKQKQADTRQSTDATVKRIRADAKASGAYFEIDVDPDTKVLKRTVYVSAYAMRHFREHMEVSFLDSTYNTNENALANAMYSTLSSTFTVLTLGFALISHEDATAYSWVMTHFTIALGLPKALIVDEDLALQCVLADSSYASVQVYLCQRHVLQNVEKNCSTDAVAGFRKVIAVRDADEFEIAFTALSKAAGGPMRDEYWAKLASTKSKWAPALRERSSMAFGITVALAEVANASLKVLGVTAKTTIGELYDVFISLGIRQLTTHVRRLEESWLPSPKFSGSPFFSMMLDGVADGVAPHVMRHMFDSALNESLSYAGTLSDDRLTVKVYRLNCDTEKFEVVDTKTWSDSCRGAEGWPCRHVIRAMSVFVGSLPINPRLVAWGDIRPLMHAHWFDDEVLATRIKRSATGKVGALSIPASSMFSSAPEAPSPALPTASSSSTSSLFAAASSLGATNASTMSGLMPATRGGAVDERARWARLQAVNTFATTDPSTRASVERFLVEQETRINALRKAAADKRTKRKSNADAAKARAAASAAPPMSTAAATSATSNASSSASSSASATQASVSSSAAPMSSANDVVLTPPRSGYRKRRRIKSSLEIKAKKSK